MKEKSLGKLLKRKELLGFIREGGMYNFKGFTKIGLLEWSIMIEGSELFKKNDVSTTLDCEAYQVVHTT